MGGRCRRVVRAKLSSCGKRYSLHGVSSATSRIELHTISLDSKILEKRRLPNDYWILSRCDATWQNVTRPLVVYWHRNRINASCHMNMSWTWSFFYGEDESLETWSRSTEHEELDMIPWNICHAMRMGLLWFIVIQSKWLDRLIESYYMAVGIHRMF